MAAELLTDASRAIDANANPLPGATWTFYDTGTTTLQAVYTDAALTTPHANPVVADAGGKFAPIYFDASKVYRGIMRTSAGVTVYDIDPLNSGVMAQLGASGGSINIGFIDNGVGAVATTVQAFLRRLNHKPSGFFYFDEGAKVQRLRDRVFMGDAADHLGTNAFTQPDWLTTYMLSKGRAFAFQQVSQVAVLTQNNGSAANGFLAGAQTSPFISAGNAIGMVGVAVNNNSSHYCGAYAGYFEGFQTPSSIGPTYGNEVDVINFKAESLTDPFQQGAMQVVGEQIASGGEFATGLFPASVGLNIQSNGSTFRKGIVFGSNALTGADGTVGTAIAIAMAKGHGIVWYSAAAVSGSAIYSTATTAANSTTITLAESATTFSNTSSGKSLFAIVNSGIATINYPKVQPSATGSPVQFLADGDDPNVGLRLVPKGTAQVQITLANVPNYANDAAASAGGVPVGGVYRNASVLMIRAA